MQIIGSLSKNGINGKQQTFPQHTLYDILRRTDHIEILMSALYLGQHDFIDVKSLINNPDIFSRLFFVPLGKLRQHILVNIVGPIIYFQYIFTRLCIIASGQRE